MTDRTHPEAGSTHIIRYALELGLLWIDGDGRNKVREALAALDILEAQLVAVGAGEAQALSAAPEGWKLVPVEPDISMQIAAKKADMDDSPLPDWLVMDWPEFLHIWHSMLAASPTPPAEQQGISPETGNSASAQGAAITSESGAVYAELPEPNLPRGGFPDLFTERQMRDFADRTHALRMEQAAPKAAPIKACVCGEPQASGTVHRVDGPCYVAAPQQEPCQTCIAMARTVMMDQVSFARKPDAYGIRQITDDEAVEAWEDIRTSPDVAREEADDMMATGRGELYEVVPLWTTPQHAPRPAPAPLSDDVVKDAARYAALRDGSIEHDDILKTVKDPGKWEQPYAVLLRGIELDSAIDAAMKEGGA